MSFLLDTNVISELRKGDRASPSVLAWIEEQQSADLYLSVLVIGELRQGVEGVRRRDSVAAEALDRWLWQLSETYADRIVPIDSTIAQLWGRLNVPDRLPTVDGLLAATAIAHDYTLVTRHVKDVKRTGASLINPFEARVSTVDEPDGD